MSRTSIPRNAASARAAFNNGGWVTPGSRGKIARQLGDDELTAAMKNTDDEAVIIPVPKGTDTSGWKKLALADLIGPHGPNSMRNRQPPKPALRFDSQVRSSGRKRTFDEANQPTLSVQLRKQKPEVTKYARTNGQDRSSGRKRTFDEANQPTMSVQLRKQKPEVTKYARTNQWDALRALSDEAEKAKPLPTILQNAWDGKLASTPKKPSSKPATGWATAAAASINKTVYVPHGVIDRLEVVGAQPKSKSVSWKQHLCTWSDAYAKTRSPSPSPPPASRGSWWSDDEMDTDDVEAAVVSAIYA
jgi:hypothetical protein